jgi:acyl-CoA synthetase (AMP-forming)/AMP-acid ligase II
MNISDMLSRNAYAYPDDIALIELAPSIAKRRQITWKEFDTRANRIASMLQKKGIRKGDKVIQLMRNSITWLEVYFGIVRTGAWVVPLNFRFTAQDIKYCIDISEAKLMIMHSEFIERVNTIKSQVTCIEEYLITGENIPTGWTVLDDELSETGYELEPVELNSMDECGLYFTSGTTGPPKPILLTHSNMEWAAITEQAHHHQGKDDNFILIPPLYHAGAKMHWFGSLLTGSRATLLTEVSPKSILEAVHEEKGSIVWLLVPWANDILHAFDSGEIKREDYDLSNWWLMHIGAQPVPPNLVRKWLKHFPDMQYDNNYGLSEATGPGCVHLGLENRGKVDTIGRAGFNWKARIVNEKDEDVNIDEPGELIVKGMGVMKEYYKNPGRTADAVKDGWLHTGDIVKMDKGGFIYLVDRKKDLIISGGENIYPVEIEEVFHTHHKVHDVAVIGIPDERLGEVVAAVISIKTGENVTQEELFVFCEEQLPRYKRPRVIIFDEVPRNPTGKLEKPKLREKYANYSA